MRSSMTGYIAAFQPKNFLKKFVSLDIKVALLGLNKPQNLRIIQALWSNSDLIDTLFNN